MTAKYQQTTKNYQQTTTNGHPCTSNQKAEVSFLLPTPDNYKHYPDFEKQRQSVRGNCFLVSQFLCSASKIGSACSGRLSSQYSSCKQEKSSFLLITFKHKRICFLVFQAPIFCSVGISYSNFLHSNENTTNVLLSISCEAVDQQVEYSLIQTSRLFKQILRSLGRLKNSRFLELFPQIELFPLTRDSFSYRESTIFSLYKVMLTSLIDYF